MSDKIKVCQVKKFGISKNSVSQIKTRIERRIVAFGRELVEREGASVSM
jgi:hypothetical protein